MPFCSELEGFMHHGLCANERNPVTHEPADLDLEDAARRFCEAADTFCASVRELIQLVEERGEIATRIQQ